MKIEGEGSVAVSPKEIWDVMFDPDFMSQVVPGCKEILQTRTDEYSVKLVLGIPALQGQYSGTLRILEKHPYDGIKGLIEGEGGLGKIKGVWETRFEQSDNDKTRVTYSVDVEIRGPMASMVGGFMEQVAISLTKQGFQKFSEAIAQTKQDPSTYPSLKDSTQSDQNMIKQILKVVFETIFKRFFNLFKPKDRR